jgi:hypothetical protein
MGEREWGTKAPRNKNLEGLHHQAKGTNDQEQEELQLGARRTIDQEQEELTRLGAIGTTTRNKRSCEP